MHCTRFLYSLCETVLSFCGEIVVHFWELHSSSLGPRGHRLIPFYVKNLFGHSYILYDGLIT